jgi:hypothetical protein
VQVLVMDNKHNQMLRMRINAKLQKRKKKPKQKKTLMQFDQEWTAQ